MHRLAQLAAAMGGGVDAAAPPAAQQATPWPAVAPQGPSVRTRARGLRRTAGWLLIGAAGWFVLNAQTPRFNAAPPVESAAPASARHPTAAAEVPVLEAGVTAVAATASSQPAAGATAVPVPTPAQAEALITRRVEAWRQAWAGRDTEAYLGFYGTDFEPPDGQSRDDWQASRYRKVGGRTDIQVSISELRVAVLEGDRARVLFLQDYASGKYRETARPKALHMAREGGEWRIVKELQGEAALAP